ncbi:hypothetical protein D9M68_672270 [compost metagenome]
MDGGAQAEGVAQVDHPLQLRCPGSEGDERQLALVQGLGHLLPVLAEGDVQQLQELLAVEPPGGVGAAAMQENAQAAVGQGLGGEQVPGQVALLAGVARPVEVDGDFRCLVALAEGLGEARQFLGVLLLVPQQHEEGAELGVFHLAIEEHAHGIAGLLACHVAGAALAFAEHADELGEGVFRRCDEVHRQLVGLGRPASLAASLAGAPLNRRLRCRLLPFSGPSFCATYLTSGRLAGDSWNSV